MQLQFLGATNTVTRSKYLLRHCKANLLIDCGLFQGLKLLPLCKWEAMPLPAFDIIDAMSTLVICHCSRGRGSSVIT